MREPEIGATATAELTVTKADLASALNEEANRYPAVFATTRMIALMEIAAARVLEPCLSPNQSSVGVEVDVTHSAPTPPGITVVATARYLKREGKLFVFRVSANDAGGEIGHGQHKRAIVEPSRLVEGAKKRVL